MYSDTEHIIDLFNDSAVITAEFIGDTNILILTCTLKQEKKIGVDPTGTTYIHLTDGVQHKRLQIVRSKEEMSIGEIDPLSSSLPPKSRVRRTRMISSTPPLLSTDDTEIPNTDAEKKGE